MTASEHINDVPLPDSLVEAHDPASSQLPSSPTVPSPLNSSETSSAQSDPIDIPDIRVLVGTFNLATRLPAPDDIPDLRSWLGPPPTTAPAIAPDIVVVGFQELLSQWHAAWLPTRRSYGASAKVAVKHQEGRLEFLDAWVQIVLDALHSVYGSNGMPVGDSSASSQTENGGARAGSALQGKDPEDELLLSHEDMETFSEDTDDSLLSNSGTHFSYEPYCVSRMVALGLLVFVRKGKGSRVKIRTVWEGTIGTGLLGIYGNKGSTAFGLDLDVIGRTHIPQSLSLCFLNAHLGPHEGDWYCNWRNEEIRHLLDTLVFYPNWGSAATCARVADDFDAAFFFGDLNYRLEDAGKKDKEEWNKYRRRVLALIDKKAVNELIEMDELSNIREHQRHSALTGFLESPITFLPSYKYNVEDEHLPSLKQQVPSERTAEQRYSKKRIPAYCDRIMYRAIDWAKVQATGATIRPFKRPGQPRSEDETHDPEKSWMAARSFTSDTISPLYYKCSPSVIWSDHKPVSALFSLKVERLSTSTTAPRGFAEKQMPALLGWVQKQRRGRFFKVVWQSSTFRVMAAITVVLAAYFLPKLLIAAQSTDWNALGDRILRTISSY